MCRSRASVSRVGAPGIRNITIIDVIGTGGRVVVIASVSDWVLSKPWSCIRPVLVAMPGFGWTPVLVWLVGHNSTNAPKIPSVQESPKIYFDEGIKRQVRRPKDSKNSTSKKANS